MTEEQALVPVAERTVIFYEDKITVVVVEAERDQAVFVPIRPLCDYLGIDWSAQRRRIVNDPVLSRRARSVAVTATEAGGKRDMTCLPLDYLNGWLFGVSASRIKDDAIRARVIRYQDECYRVLARAFAGDQAAAAPVMNTLLQVREMGRAIMQLAEEQMAYERRLTTTEQQVERAVGVVSDLTRRVDALEQRVAPGAPVTEEQASQISQAVKAVAMALSRQSGTNQYGSVYGELYRRFGITSYKMLPVSRFAEAMSWLTEWHQSLAGDAPF